MGKAPAVFCHPVAVDVDAVVASLEPAFSVSVGDRSEATRTWLDTFDWRLHAAGIFLEFVDNGTLSLHFPDGTLLQSSRERVRWPAHPHALADGPLRDALTPIVAPRALLPVVAVRCTTQLLEVRNDDEKIVSRLLVVGVADIAGLLRIRPLRGYDDDGARIARLLAAVDGFTAVTTTPYDLALTRAPRRPSDAADPADTLRPDMPAAVAIAQMLEQFAVAIAENVPGTIAAIDTEFLHDLRVAVRRTRSILKLAGDVLPDDLAKRFGPEFKWLGDLTTPVRDLDVYLLDIDAMAARLISADPGELDPFRAFLVKHRAAERRRLVRGLRSRRFEELLSEWRAALAHVIAHAAGEPTVAALARQRIGRAHRNAVRRGKRINADSPGADVHSLRKRCKELRYLLEVFRPVCARAPHRRLLKELKALQDTLGDFQDGEVQREAIREFAAAMMEQDAAPPATVLAMGELAAQLDAHQQNARAALSGRLEPFLNAANRSLVKALVR